METVETRVSKSSFSGTKGAKKERKMLEKSSTSYLGSRRREFESPHSDQKSGLLNNPKEKSQILSGNGKGLLFSAHYDCG